MPDRVADETAALFERKRAWHKAQADAPLREKVRVRGATVARRGGSNVSYPPLTSEWVAIVVLLDQKVVLVRTASCREEEEPNTRRSECPRSMQ